MKLVYNTVFPDDKSWEGRLRERLQNCEAYLLLPLFIVEIISLLALIVIRGPLWIVEQLWILPAFFLQPVVVGTIWAIASHPDKGNRYFIGSDKPIEWEAFESWISKVKLWYLFGLVLDGMGIMLLLVSLLELLAIRSPASYSPLILVFLGLLLTMPLNLWIQKYRRGGVDANHASPG